MKFSLIVLCSFGILGFCHGAEDPFWSKNPDDPLYRELLDLAVEKQRKEDPSKLRGATPVKFVLYVDYEPASDGPFYRIAFITAAKKDKVGYYQRNSCMTLFAYHVNGTGASLENKWWDCEQMV